jgi:hypothetical protein
MAEHWSYSGSCSAQMKTAADLHVFLLYISILHALSTQLTNWGLFFPFFKKKNWGLFATPGLLRTLVCVPF